jgi:hypothetical protein
VHACMLMCVYACVPVCVRACVCLCVCVRACVRASSAGVYACTRVRVQACLCMRVCLVVLMMSWLMVCAPHSTPRLHKGTFLCCVDAWTLKDESEPSLKRGHEPNQSKLTIVIFGTRYI